MRTVFRVIFLILTSSILLESCTAQPVVCPAGQNEIAISDAWSRPTALLHSSGTPAIPEGISGAAYLTITNCTPNSDRLVRITTAVAELPQIHKTEMKDGIMSMSELSNGIEVAGGQQVIFKPGEIHIMLMKLTTELVAGDQYTLTLVFERAGKKDVTVTVRKP